MHRHFAWRHRRAATSRNHHIVCVLTRLHMGHKSGITHQIHHALHRIALSVKTQVIGRRQVAPLNAPLGVEQHHPIGRRLNRGEELLEAHLCLQRALIPRAQRAPRAIGNLTPQAVHDGKSHLAVPGIHTPQPTRHTKPAQQVGNKPGHRSRDRTQGHAPLPARPRAQQRSREQDAKKQCDSKQHVGWGAGKAQAARTGAAGEAVRR